MSHVVGDPGRTVEAVGGGIQIDCIPTGGDNLTWVLRNRRTGDVVVVDGPEAEPVIAWLEERGRTPTAIWLTHGHGDHVGLVPGLKARWPQVQVVGRGVPHLTRRVHDGARIWLGDLQAKVLVTHGHMEDHLCYHLGDLVLTGDTLFSGGCGRAFGGPLSALHTSLQRLAALPEDTMVLCGHEYTQDNLRFAWLIEPDNPHLRERIRQVWEVRHQGGLAAHTDIGTEKRTNPFLRVHSPTIHARLREYGADFDHEHHASVFAALRRLKDRSPHRELGDTHLPL